MWSGFDTERRPTMTTLDQPRASRHARPASDPPAARRAPLAVVLSATFIATLDVFIVNVSIPAISADLHASAGVVAQLVAWMGQASFFLVLAVYLQDGLGLSALRSGVLFTAVGSGYLATSLASSAVAARIGKQAVALGAAAMVCGLALLEVAVHTGGEVGWLIPGLAVDGTGMGLIIAPLAGIVPANVVPRHAGATSGVLSTVMQIGGALGVAVIGPVFCQGATIPTAFHDSLLLLMGVAGAVMIAIQLLPTTPRKDQS
jgi:MFS family permease